MAGKWAQSNPLSIPYQETVIPKSVRPVYYTKVHPEGMQVTPASYVGEYAASTFAFALIACFITFIIHMNRRQLNVDQRPEPTESIIDIIRRCNVPARSKQSISLRNHDPRDQQPLVPAGQQHNSHWRDERGGHEEDPIQDRSRHPRGSALEAWSRHLQTKSKP